MTQAEWLQRLQELEKLGGDWVANPSGCHWGLAQAGDAESAKHWFALDFHLRRLLVDDFDPTEGPLHAWRFVELAEQLRKNSPERPAAALGILGAAHYRAGNYPEAVKHLEEAVAKQQAGGTVWAQLFLAMSHHQLGDGAKAKDYIRKADAKLKHIQEDKDTPPNWPELLRDTALRQEVEVVLKAPAAERAKDAP